MLRTTGTGPVLAPRGMRRQDRPIIHCVYLTTEAREAEAVAWLVAPRRIEIHRASSLREASDLLARSGSRVLLSETRFESGGWSDALRMVRREHAETDLIKAVRAVREGRSYFSPAVSRMLLEDYIRQLQQRGVEDSYELLSSREREILQLVAEGKANKEIATLLNLSLYAVETHRTHILQKLNLHSVPELILYAVRKGIIS